jgi:hypothetical protein
MKEQLINGHMSYSNNLNYWGMHPVARVSIKYLILLTLFLNTDLNILAFYTTTCFRLTVTTAFALLYI